MPGALLLLVLAAALPDNLAATARITANSAYSDGYAARLVADGRIPIALGRDDVGAAWAVQGETHRAGASLTFEWDRPVTVAQVVYFGRTAWMVSECWAAVEVLADDTPEPLLRAALEARDGPQPLRLPQPVTLRRLTLRFVGSHGGLNPGASEIRVYSRVLTAAELGVPGVLPELDSARARLAAGEFGFRELIAVRRKLIHPSHVYSYHVEGLSPGGALVRLSVAADGTVGERVLVDAGEGLILNADLDFAGRRLVFAWKRTMAEPFGLWTVGVDGDDLRPIVSGGNCVDPCWLPDGGIAFLTDQAPAFAYCHISTSPVLWRCDADGGRPTRLSANYLNDFTPAVLPDGRLVYSRWEYVDRPAIPIQSLWTINPDGTGLAGLFGNRMLSPATFMEARPIPGRRELLCVLTAHNGPCRGAIGLVDPSLGANQPDGVRNLTPEVIVGPAFSGDGNGVRGPYESPYPIDATWYLVSRAGTLQLRDYAGAGQVTLAEPAGELGLFSPRPIRRSPVPPVRSSGLDPTATPEATIVMHDVYAGLEPAVDRGDVVELAIVQEIAKSEWASNAYRAFGFQFPVVSCGATYAPKKVHGYVPVEADGSAHFRVPAGVPLSFYALDRQGRAVQRMRSFTHFAAGEKQGCIGCHADRNSAAPPVTPGRAVLRAPDAIAPPDWGVDGFRYAQVVQPVLDAACVRCHDAPSPAGGVDLSGDLTDYFNVSYETLARAGTPSEDSTIGGAGGSFAGSRWVRWIPTYNGQEQNILNVAPRAWGAVASPLAELIATGHPDAAGRPRVALTDTQRRRLYAWMDLNAPYYGMSTSRFADLPGCRRIYPGRLDAALADVAARRCAGCHQAVPRRFYTRITRPERNEFLTAPLARAAGGSQRCGTIFADTTDADYQQLLATFNETTKLLAERPREDLAP